MPSRAGESSLSSRTYSEVLDPRTRAAWRELLEKNHGSSSGMRIVITRKGGSKSGLGYAEAVEEALCFGWIDHNPRKIDGERFSLCVSPRRTGSVWSKINKSRVKMLTESGAMTPAGLAKIQAAKKDGSWRSIDAIEELRIPPDLGKALRRNAKARKGFSLKRTSEKKPETRAARIAKTVEKAGDAARA